MEEESSLTNQESLDLIRQMVLVAKQEEKDDGRGWIVWGYLLVSASIFTFLNIRYGWMSDMYFFWNAFGAIALGYFLFRIVRYFRLKRPPVRTYTCDLLNKLNIGFFMSLGFIIMATMQGRLGVSVGFGLLINLYGFWVLIYGTILNFRPSIVGAFLVWGCGFVALFQDSFSAVMLLHAAAVCFGYIIPGHWANIEFSKMHRQLEMPRV